MAFWRTFAATQGVRLSTQGLGFGTSAGLGLGQGLSSLGSGAGFGAAASGLTTAAAAAGGGPVGLAVVAVTQFAKALEDATEKAKEFREGLAGSSPEIAAIQQEANVRNLARARAIGAETASTTREAMLAEQEKLDRRREIDVAVQNAVNQLSTFWENVKGDIYKQLSPIAESLNRIARNGAPGRDAAPLAPDALLDQFARMEDGWRKGRNPKWEPRPLPKQFVPGPVPNPANPGDIWQELKDAIGRWRPLWNW